MKRLGIIFFASIIVLFLFNCRSDKGTSDTPQSIKIAFYNLENLFDTIDDPNTEDSEFLPDSKLNWDTKKVSKKIENISKVLLGIGKTNPPEIIGLCEVENQNILTDLIQLSDLKKHNYQIIHKESPDFRGIDVALIYRQEKYTPIKNEWIKINFPFDPDYTTRDILYSEGKLVNGDTVHIFVNHWTSRWGGQEVTEAKRIYIAKLIKSKTDQILENNPHANIIIMGDLNDNPTDKSLTEGLKCISLNGSAKNNKLYNLSAPKYSNGEGSLYYKSWDLFDQMIVSGNLLNKQSKTSVHGSTHNIFKEDWVLFTDNKGNKRPSRTASGGKYYGGYSDHLPVWIELDFKQN